MHGLHHRHRFTSVTYPVARQLPQAALRRGVHGVGHRLVTKRVAVLGGCSVVVGERGGGA